MNGDKFLIDTNILLYLVANKIKVEDLPEGEFYISFVTELEALSYSSISANEEKDIEKLLMEIPIVDIDKEVKEKTVVFRKKYNLRLPDAIIAATAFVIKACLITNDKELLVVSEIQTKSIRI